MFIIEATNRKKAYNIIFKRIFIYIITLACTIVFTSPDVGAYSQYSNRSEELFKAAATDYYGSQNRQGSSESVLSGVPCQPKDVKIKYIKSKESELAHVRALFLAYGGDRWYSEWADQWPDWVKEKGVDFFRDGYCTVYFNQSSHRETRANACITFIHEYGHLLGREHNDNINSPMYTHYAEVKDPLKGYNLFVRYRKHFLGKTICDGKIRW